MLALPQYVVSTVSERGFIGVYDQSALIGDGWIGVLLLSDGTCIWGRFCDLDPAAHTASFLPDDPRDLLRAHAGNSYTYLDGYWGERAELVLDRSVQWKPAAFEPQDAVQYATPDGTARTVFRADAPPGGTVVPKGWDHDHCEICWATISQATSDRGYLTSDHRWVCTVCYDAYVVNRSLEFVTL